MNNDLLTEESRRDLIDKIIEADIKFAKENDGLEVSYHCDRHNGLKGYTNYTDRELLEQVVFWQFGFDVEWKKN